MVDKVVVDKDILGWAADHEKEILNGYKEIIMVGKDPRLPQSSFDASIASFCKSSNCDFLTADKNAYTHYFEAKIKTIQVSRFTFYKEGNRPIYLIKIVK